MIHWKPILLRVAVIYVVAAVWRHFVVAPVAREDYHFVSRAVLPGETMLQIVVRQVIFGIGWGEFVCPAIVAAYFALHPGGPRPPSVQQRFATFCATFLVGWLVFPHHYL